MLKKIPYPPPGNRDVDASFTIKEDPPSDGDMSFIRRFNTGYALQCFALPAAGSPENSKDTALMMKGYIEGKGPPVFIDRNINHAGRLLSRLRFSKRLTVIKTTALMAMLTKTQMKALYSSLVRHNWYTVVEIVAVCLGI